MSTKIQKINNFHEASQSLESITNRTSSGSQETVTKIVEEILGEIQKSGDEALFKFTEKYDGFRPDPLEVPQEKLKKAWEETPFNLQDALKTAKERIEKFHYLQIPKDISFTGDTGEKLGRRWGPVEKAGIYIPGGRASYPSTVIMNAIPAKVAGVKELIMVTPAGKDGEINSTVMAAAYLLGIERVFRIGGAQAIAALAFGTETIPKVDVISGPGNIFVTLAKKSVYGKVGIDSLAGPSEVLIIADKSAKIEQIASDLLAQAEHDPLAAAILITTELKIIDSLPEEIDKQLKNHPRAEICKKSLEDWGVLIHCESLDECIKLSDEFAPEHLEILTEDPCEVSKKINNAGAIFIGPWTPEAVGDYLAGPNHTLPTSGTARFSGALSVETFMKNTSIIQFNSKALTRNKEAIVELAKSEGLFSHAQSIRIRSD